MAGLHWLNSVVFEALVVILTGTVCPVISVTLSVTISVGSSGGIQTDFKCV